EMIEKMTENDRNGARDLLKRHRPLISENDRKRLSEKEEEEKKKKSFKSLDIKDLSQDNYRVYYP
ncbi:unnamed protein product, partial [Ilex paraguariensis]